MYQMDVKLKCPTAANWKTKPGDDDPMKEACAECPALLRQVDERGTVSFYCLVYSNKFRSPGAAQTLTTKPPTKASWSRERLGEH
jgi:hypothetical protein